MGKAPISLMIIFPLRDPNGCLTSIETSDAPRRRINFDLIRLFHLNLYRFLNLLALLVLGIEQGQLRSKFPLALKEELKPRWPSRLLEAGT